MLKSFTRITVLLAAFITVIISTGCGKDILIDEDAQYELTAMTDAELLNDTYYIKDKTKFYSTYAISNANLDHAAREVSPDRLAWFDRDETLIPTLYADEVIAYASESSDLDAVTLERLQYNGASIGVYGGTVNEEGYYEVNTNGVVKESDIYNFFQTLDTDDIKIISVNGEKITEKQINTAGFFKNLEKGASVKLELYAGTKYLTVNVLADYYYLQSYELYTIDKAIMTKNGYIALSMPEGAKSGYYAIEGNVFKYCAFEKGKGNEEDVNKNVAFYDNEVEQLAAYSQQFSISIKTTTNNVTFVVAYDDTNYDTENIRCVLQSPDEQLYDMEVAKGQASLAMNEAIAGKWVLNVAPKDLPIQSVDAVSDVGEKDAIADAYEFTIGEDLTNQRFFATYTGEGSIWGVVENEDGETQNMEISSKPKTTAAGSEDGVIETTIAYLKAGTYKMTIYHYEDAAVTDYGYEEDENNIEEEIITVEE